MDNNNLNGQNLPDYEPTLVLPESQLNGGVPTVPRPEGFQAAPDYTATQPLQDPYQATQPVQGQSGVNGGMQAGPVPGMSYDPSSQYNQTDYGRGLGPGIAPVGGPSGTVPKKGKTGLIIGVCAGLALLVAAVLCIFVFDLFGIMGKKGGKSAEATVEKMMKAFEDADADGFLSCIPEELWLSNSMGYGTSKEEIQQTLDLMKGFGLKIKDIKTADKGTMDKEVLKTAIKERFGVDLDIEEGQKVECTMTMEMSFMGEESSETETTTFACAKIGGKWYVIGDVDGIESGSVDTTEVFTTGEVTEEITFDNTETTEEVSLHEFVCNAPGAQGDASGISENIRDFEFKLDGNAVKMLGTVQQFGDWKLDLENSGSYTEDYVLNAGDSTYSIDLKKDNTEYDFWFSLSASVGNAGKDLIKINEGVLINFHSSISFCDTDNYPSVVLPKGITWGSNLDQVIAAYGEPDYSYVYDDNAYVEYRNDSWDSVDLTINSEKGVVDISLYNYSWDAAQ